MQYHLRPDFIYMARHPENYRGDARKQKYFEGWYYNIKTKQGDTFVLIPGIAKDKNGQGHAFIQIIDDGKSYNVIYNMSEFWFNDQPFSIIIGDNKFSLFSVNLDIKGENRYQGDLYFRNSIKLRKTKYAPSIMGPFSYYPFMQCNHGILCINADTKGKIDTGKKEMDFEDGSVYIEKDWGSSFPKSYVWVQCNKFEGGVAKLSLSIADVPFLMSSFRGVIAVFQRGKRQYVFSSYYFARIKKLEVSKEAAEIELKQGDYVLRVAVDSNKNIQLLAPHRGAMKENVYESITARIFVQLYYKKRLIYEAKGSEAGYEYRPDDSK